MKNWKTTTSGILTALVAIITAIVIPLLDGTSLNGDAVVTAIMSVITALGLICAKDSNTGDGGAGPQQAKSTIKALSKRLGLIIILCAIALVLPACDHNVAITPGGAVIDKGDSSLVIDKDMQTITYTQHVSEPPRVDPVIVIHQHK